MVQSIQLDADATEGLPVHLLDQVSFLLQVVGAGPEHQHQGAAAVIPGVQPALGNGEYLGGAFLRELGFDLRGCGVGRWAVAEGKLAQACALAGRGGRVGHHCLRWGEERRAGEWVSGLGIQSPTTEYIEIFAVD